MALLRSASTRGKILALSVFTVIHVLVACASALASYGTSIRVGVFDCVPLCSKDPGTNGGMLVDILTYVAEEERWELVFVPGSLQQNMERLESGEIDVLVAAPYSKEQTRAYDFTRQTIISTWAQVYRRPNAAIRSILDLNGLSVGIVRDDPYNQEFRATVKSFNITCRFIEFVNYDEALNAIEKEWIDAAIVDRLYGIIHAKDRNVEKTTIIFSPVEFRYAVRKNINGKIISAIDYHVDALKKNPYSIYYRLLHQISGESINSRVLYYLKWGLVTTVVLLVPLLLMSMVLRYKVKVRTAELVRKNAELGNEIAMRRVAEQDLSRRKEYLTALHETTLELIGHLNLQDLLETIVSRAAVLVHAPHGFLYLHDAKKDMLEVRVGLGIFLPTVGKAEKPEEGLAGKVFQTGNPVVMDMNTDMCDAWPDDGSGSVYSDKFSVVGVPLTLGDTVTGVIGVARITSSAEFGREEIEVLSQFADMASIALNNAHLYARLEEELSQREKAERALEESEERYRNVFENTGSAMAIIENDMTLSMVNAEFEKMTGYGKYETEDVMKFVNLVAEKDRDRLEGYHRDRRCGDSSAPRAYEFTCIGKGKEEKDVYVRVSMIPDTKKSIISMVDVSELKRNEAERMRLAAVIEQSSEAVVIADSRAIIQYANPAFESLTGYSRREIIGEKTDLWVYSHVNKDAGYVISEDSMRRKRISNKRKDGTLFETETMMFPIKDASGAIVDYVIIMRDITVETQLESQLRQSQKMEAIGTLSGGIAHDFNNILTPIIGYSELALQSVAEGSKVSWMLGNILTASTRARELVDQILTFSRRSEQKQRPLNLQLVVKEVVKLLKVSVPPSIELRQEMEQEECIIMADLTQIHQVLLNLCTNAVHAMNGKGGVLTISLKKIDVGGKSAPPHIDLSAGTYVRLSVSDTGCGMDRTTQERIFEPFFTTKEKGEGTGMGLAVVHGIVSGHNGAVAVESAPGDGTTFHCYFPGIKTNFITEEREKFVMPRGSEHIMIVDDEQCVIEVARKMLESLGYKVTARINSTDALEEFRKNPHHFDLVITDLTMPNLTGVALTEELLRIRPDVPVILCTGYGEASTLEKARSSGVQKCISKPFMRSDLAVAVRNVLDTNEEWSNVLHFNGERHGGGKTHAEI